MPDYFKDYKAALASGQGTPTSPLGDFPELRQANNVNFAGPATVGQPQANAAQAAVGYNNSLNDHASALSDKLKLLTDAANGKNYQQLPKADGGFDFKDPLGNPLTVSQYAKATGSDPVSLLKSSQNSLDRQFVNDFQNTQTIANALINNDKATIDKLAIQLYGNQDKLDDKNKQKKIDKDNQDVANRFWESLKKMGNGDALIRNFVNYYPDVYGQASPQSSQIHGAGLPGYPRP